MLTGALPLVVDVWGVGVVVSMYVCVAWGLLPPWFCWCVGGLVVGGVHGVGVLVCWCLWCVAWVITPLWFGVLVIWCVCAHVCLLLNGMMPHCGLVVLVCRWCVDWGVAPLWVGVLVVWCVCPCMCVPGGCCHPCGLVVFGVLVVCCLGACHRCCLVAWGVAPC